MREVHEDGLDQLFRVRNDVLFAREFLDDVPRLEFSPLRPEKVPKPDAFDGIADTEAAVLYRWAEQELQFFVGSARKVVGAEAKQLDLPGLWMVSVELVQLLGRSVSILFHFDEKAQVVRILAAMPTWWKTIPPLLEFRIECAKERLGALLTVEMVDTVVRTNRLKSLLKSPA